MSILIKGMEMPKDGEHPLWIALHSDGTVEYNANKGDGWQMTTAVPVPPHGDLIDRRELIKHDHQHYEYLSDEFYITVRDIENAPAIIKAEEGE